MRTTAVYILLACLAAGVAADRLSAREVLPNTGDKRVGTILWEGRQKLKHLEDYNNVVAISYNDSTVVVASDSCTLFKPVPFVFNSGIDVAKYWYDFEKYYITISNDFVADGELTGIWVIDVDAYNGIECLPGNRIRYAIFPDEKSYISDGIIFDNQIQITTVPIGASVSDVVAAINPSENVDQDGVKSITLLKYTIPENGFCRPFNFNTPVTLTFASDTLKTIEVANIVTAEVVNSFL